MNNTKRCSGYKGHHECANEYPDHMVPVSEFCSDRTSKDRLHHLCHKCMRYRNKLHAHTRIKHPLTGENKDDWKRRMAAKAGGIIRTQEWRGYLKKADADWHEEIKAAAWLGTIFPVPPKYDLPVSKPARKRVNAIYDKPLPKEGWVYIMDTYRYKKIGKTWENGLRARRTEARRWCPADLVYWAWFDDAKAAEAEIHRRLKRYKVEKENVGEELFNCTIDTAKDEIEKLQEELEDYAREKQEMG